MKNMFKKLFSIEQEIENNEKEIQKSIDQILLGEDEICAVKPNSRINGKPIYRYISKDFLSFREKYENYNPEFGIR